MRTNRSSIKRDHNRRVLIAAMLPLESRLLLAAGDPDSAFGASGVFTTSMANQDVAYAIALQNDGKILLAGYSGDGSQTKNDLAVVRLTTAGALDSSFGTGGKSVIDLGNSENINAIAVQTDGAIIVAGDTQAGPGVAGNMFIARLTSTGALDTTFGTNGFTIVDFYGYRDSVEDIALQGDKIIVVGYATGSTSEAAVVRLNSNGALDGTFGTGGKVTTNVLNNVDTASGVVIQSDQKIVVAGRATNSGGYNQFSLIRYTANGTLDNTFGAGGKTTTDFGASSWAKDIAIDPATGKFIVGGLIGQTVSGQPVGRFGVARYTTTGALDVSFGSSGSRVIPNAKGEYFYGYGLGLQSDGSILFGGTSKVDVPAFGSLFAVARFTPAGAIDTAFGVNGLASTAISSYDSSYDLAVQSDDKVILAGSDGLDVVAVRYLTSGSSTNNFASVDANGKLTVNGTSGDDVITIAGASDFYTVSLGSQSLQFVYGAVKSIDVKAGAGNDVVNIDSAAQGGVAGGSVDLGTGNDALNVGIFNKQEVLDVLGGDGADTVTVRSAAFYSVRFTGGLGADTLVFQGSPGDDTLEVNNGRLSSSPTSAEALASVEAITVNADFGFDTINIKATLNGIAYTMNGGVGQDTFNVGNNGLADPILGTVTINGDVDDDTVNINDQSSAYHDPYYVTQQSVSRQYMATVYCNAVENLAINTSKGNNAINISGVVPTKSLVINNAGGNDTLNYDTAVARAVTFNGGAGNAVINIRQGILMFTEDPSVSAPNLVVNVRNGGTAHFRSTLHLPTLNIEDGGRALFPAGIMQALFTRNLNISSGGQLDLNEGDLVFQATDTTRSAAYAALVALIKSGRNAPGGRWTGMGIVTSAAIADPNRGLAAAINDKGNGTVILPTFAGLDVTINDILVKHTWNGDMDFSGKINADDYFRVDSGFLARPTSPVYRDGDLNFDGKVNADDYFMIDSAFLGQKGILSASAPRAAASVTVKKAPFRDGQPISRKRLSIARKIKVQRRN